MTWFQLQGIEAELAVVHDIAGNQRDSLEMVERLVSAGSAHEFDRLRAEALLHNVEAAVPDLERRRAATRNALAVLLAEAPQAFSPPVARASGERLTLRTLGVGDPGDCWRVAPTSPRPNATWRPRPHVSASRPRGCIRRSRYAARSAWSPAISMLWTRVVRPSTS